jgi:hypothetical protein
MIAKVSVVMTVALEVANLEVAKQIVGDTLGVPMPLNLGPGGEQLMFLVERIDARETSMNTTPRLKRAPNRQDLVQTIRRAEGRPANKQLRAEAREARRLLAEMDRRANATDVRCPTCGAAEGFYCRVEEIGRP